MSNLLEKHYVTIDPLALLLPTSIYVRLVDKFHPHVPKVAEVVEVLKKATPAELNEVKDRTAAIVACSRVVEEAMANVKQ